LSPRPKFDKTVVPFLVEGVVMSLQRRLVQFVLSALVISPNFALAEVERYDLLIQNTLIVDGTAKPAYEGDVAIRGDRIVAVGRVDGEATTVLDGTGLTTSPGFVDPHSHADFSLLKYPLAENLVMQGITTLVGGNCGLSLAPRHPDQDVGLKEEDIGMPIDWETLDEFLSALEKKGTSINYVPLVGHGAVRSYVMGADFRRNATPQEIAAMKHLVEKAMKSGAFGLSTGLDYEPGRFANFDELVELAKVTQWMGGIYASHTRYNNSEWPTEDPEEVSYGRYPGEPENIWVGLYRGVVEAIDIGRKAQIPVHISHIANVYRIPQPHPDFLEEAAAKATLWVLDQALDEGVDLTFDVIATADSISAQQKLIDGFYSRRVRGLQWVHELEKSDFIRRLDTREFRDRLIRVHTEGRLKLGMVHTKADPYWSDCFRILTTANKDYEGKTVGEIARLENKDPLETIFDLLVADPDTTWVQYLDRRGTDIMNAVFIAHPAAIPSTDMDALPAVLEKGDDSPPPPPAAYGLYPHYIGHYIRDKKVIGLEEAIRKATQAPAERFGLKDRGVLRPGACADIVVFDFDRIIDQGDFVDPTRPPVGIEYVVVNGKIVYKDMKHTGAKPGRVLRRSP
jgi:N-acyl-D-amino-acid deacylase